MAKRSSVQVDYPDSDYFEPDRVAVAISVLKELLHELPDLAFQIKNSKPCKNVPYTELWRENGILSIRNANPSKTRKWYIAFLNGLSNDDLINWRIIQATVARDSCPYRIQKHLVVSTRPLSKREWENVLQSVKESL
jgi:hypothetical protein